ncbi:MAG: hypothetical protein NTX33_00065 [Propionibacteriales bacterium]|nr:hypothetical protein [Propionibacteriales bacterium]
MKAPEMMFLSAPTLDTDRDDPVIDQSSADMVVFQISDVASDKAVARFSLWPETLDFVTPAKYVSKLAMWTMFAVATVQFVCAGLAGEKSLFRVAGLCGEEGWCAGVRYDLVRHLTEQADAAMAVILLLPVIAVGQLTVLSQNSIRWAALRPYRIASLLTTLPLALLAAMTMAGFPFYDGYFAAAIWFACGLISGLFRRWLRSHEYAIAQAKYDAVRQMEYRLAFPTDSDG